MNWLDNIAGPQYAPAVMWTVGALVVLVIVLLLVRVARGVSSGTFVAGGRNRRARLAVMDAAAVDNQRRLVLVRRDNVEHLILIGGPTDVVVEQNILPAAALHTPPVPTGSEPTKGLAPRPAPLPVAPAAAQPRARRDERPEPVASPEPAVETPVSQVPEEAPAPAPERQEPAFAPERETPVAARPPQLTEAGTPTAASPTARSGSIHFLDKARIGPAPQAAAATPPAPAPVAPEVRAPEPAGAPQHVARLEPAIAPAHPQPQDDLDSALREELKAPLADEPAGPQAGEPSLEDEMRRLLGELSAPARK